MSDYIFLYWDDLPLGKSETNEQDSKVLHRQDTRHRGEGCGDGLPTRQLQHRYGLDLPDESREEA